MASNDCCQFGSTLWDSQSDQTLVLSAYLDHHNNIQGSKMGQERTKLGFSRLLLYSPWQICVWRK